MIGIVRACLCAAVFAAAMMGSIEIDPAAGARAPTAPAGFLCDRQGPPSAALARAAACDTIG